MSKILLLGASTSILEKLETELAAQGFQPLLGPNLALQSDLKGSSPDLILLDITTAHHEALTLCRKLKADPHWEDVPLILLSEINDPESFIAGLDAGAADVIVNPLRNLELDFSKIRAQLTHYRKNTALKRQLQRTQKRQQLGQDLLDGSQEGILVFNKAGQITFCNYAARTMLAYEADELTGQTINSLLSPGTGVAELLNGLPSGDQQQSTSERMTLLSKNKDEIMVSAYLGLTNSPAAGNGNHALLFRDISKQLAYEEKLLKLAKYDLLTGLANRNQYHDFTTGLIAYCERHEKTFTMMMLDLDHFKNINDTYGHPSGDELLIQVAKRLKDSVRASDLIARIGGDEYALTILDLSTPETVAGAAQKILKIVNEPYLIDNHEIYVSPSIGIATYPECGQNLGDLTKAAETALLDAKQEGRNNFKFFSLEAQQRAQERSLIETKLHLSLNNNDLELFYQPRVGTFDKELRSMEALIRWTGNNENNIGPDKFIPVAEECGLIAAIGEWVLRNACRQMMSWRKQGIIKTPLTISVNLSSRQLDDPQFPKILKSILKETGLDPRLLELELTETALMNEPGKAIEALETIQRMGVSISVDDFGTGYSSLNYLKQLPIDILKIDRSFIKDIGVDKNNEVIIEAILAMAHSLHLKVIAEGVEKQLQIDFLKYHGCEQIQGYYFSKPLCADDMSTLIQQENIDWERLDNLIIKSGSEAGRPGSLRE